MQINQQIDQFVTRITTQEQPVLDLRVLRSLTTLRLDVPSQPAYQHFLGCCENYLPVENMVAWLKLEKPNMAEAEYAALRALVEPVELFARTLPTPVSFGSTYFRGALSQERSRVARAAALKQWGDQPRVTATTIRTLHRWLATGNYTQAQAAAAANISTATAHLLRCRTYKSWTPELDAAWSETFGAQPVNPPVKGGHQAMRPETLAVRDREKAELLRKVHHMLTFVPQGGRPLTTKEVAAFMGCNVSKITRLISQEPSKAGPESTLAWRETFGASQNRQEGHY